MENNIITCKNCDQEFQKEYEFCPHCGQKSKEGLTMGVLFYNTISNYFSFDARFLKSFIPLMFRPGFLAEKFVEGKRLRYLHPAQTYLFVSVIFFFLFSFQQREYTLQADKALKKGFESNKISAFDTITKSALDSVNLSKISKSLKDKQLITDLDVKELEKLDSVINSNKNSEDDLNAIFGFDKSKVDSLTAVGATEKELLKAMGMKDDAGFFKRRFYSQLLKFQKNSGVGILQAFFDSIPIAMFVLLPIFAFLLKLFFWRRGSFSHHLVFSFYFFSFLFIVLSIVLIANLIWDVPDSIDWMVVLSTFFYLLFAIKKFYHQRFFMSFFKTGFITFFYFLFVIPIALGIMGAASFFYY